jgi:hypothetical protein
MPTPIHPFQLAEKFGLTPDPRLAVVNNREEFDFQMKQSNFWEFKRRRLMGLRA